MLERVIDPDATRRLYELTVGAATSVGRVAMNTAPASGAGAVGASLHPIIKGGAQTPT